MYINYEQLKEKCDFKIMVGNHSGYDFGYKFTNDVFIFGAKFVNVCFIEIINMYSFTLVNKKMDIVIINISKDDMLNINNYRVYNYYSKDIHLILLDPEYQRMIEYYDTVTDDDADSNNQYMSVYSEDLFLEFQKICNSLEAGDIICYMTNYLIDGQGGQYINDEYINDPDLESIGLSTFNLYIDIEKGGNEVKEIISKYKNHPDNIFNDWGDYSDKERKFCSMNDVTILNMSIKDYNTLMNIFKQLYLHDDLSIALLYVYKIKNAVTHYKLNKLADGIKEIYFIGESLEIILTNDIKVSCYYNNYKKLLNIEYYYESSSKLITEEDIEWHEHFTFKADDPLLDIVINRVLGKEIN